MDVKEAARIRRKDAIPPGDQTDRRDQIAEYIEDMWPATLTTIAEAADASRHTVSTTLELYFEPAEQPLAGTQSLESVLDVDEQKLIAVFRRGYQLGWEDRGRMEEGGIVDTRGRGEDGESG